ncbi:MAG: toll/interleukin-1 receptor domain-containing protein [Chlorobi bacterium]|nr:toll/interleukin-1 receptor domain-containing protein [Chlorobiota bacterium]
MGIMKKIFFSYSERRKETLQALIADLKELSNYELWIDQKLTGGQQWWNEILKNIRECDVFLFALSAESLESEACSREYIYAYGLGKNILPVLVADGVAINLLPKELKEVQFVDYRAADKHAFMRLVSALDSLPESTALPEVMPEEPEVPVSYIDELFSVIRSSDPMSFEQQASILVKLKEKLHSESERQDAIKLLEKLRDRDDLYSKIGNQVADILASETDGVAGKVGPGARKQALFSAEEKQEERLSSRFGEESFRADSGEKNPGTDKEINRKNRAVLFAAAAVIVVLAGVLYMFFNPGSEYSGSDHTADSTGAVIPAPPQWAVTAGDDFSVLPCRWYCGPYSGNLLTAQTSQLGGQYMVAVNFGQPDIFRIPSPYSPVNDFYLEAQVQIISTNSQSVSAGLYFRADGNGYYVLRAADNGQYTLCYNANGVFRDLINWTHIENFNPFQKNRIGILAEGSRISVFINGTKVGEVLDSSSLSGVTGIEISAWNPMQVSVAFDNVVLRQKSLQGS